MLSQPEPTIEVIRKGVAAVQKCRPKQVYVSRAKEMPFARQRCRRATFGPGLPKSGSAASQQLSGATAAVALARSGRWQVTLR